MVVRKLTFLVRTSKRQFRKTTDHAAAELGSTASVGMSAPCSFTLLERSILSLICLGGGISMPPTMGRTRPSSVKSKVFSTPSPPRQVHAISSSTLFTTSPGWFYVVDTDKSGQLDDAEIGRALAQANVANRQPLLLPGRRNSPRLLLLHITDHAEPGHTEAPGADLRHRSNRPDWRARVCVPLPVCALPPQRLCLAGP
jgi:hypothetical protein